MSAIISTLIVIHKYSSLTCQNLNTGSETPLEIASLLNDRVANYRETKYKETTRLLEAAAAGLPLSPALILDSDLLKRIEQKIIGCSGGEVERKAGNDESADGGGSDIRLRHIL